MRSKNDEEKENGYRDNLNLWVILHLSHILYHKADVPNLVIYLN